MPSPVAHIPVALAKELDLCILESLQDAHEYVSHPSSYYEIPHILSSIPCPENAACLLSIQERSTEPDVPGIRRAATILVCPVCGQQFQREDTRRRHMEAAHRQ